MPNQDFTISASFNIVPQNKSFPTNQASIVFQAAQACTLTFPDATNCFGQTSVSLVQGSNIVSVKSAVTSDGEVTAPPSPEAQQNPDTFEITFN